MYHRLFFLEKSIFLAKIWHWETLEEKNERVNLKLTFWLKNKMQKEQLKRNTAKKATPIFYINKESFKNTGRDNRH